MEMVWFTQHADADFSNTAGHRHHHRRVVMLYFFNALFFVSPLGRTLFVLKLRFFELLHCDCTGGDGNYVGAFGMIWELDCGSYQHGQYLLCKNQRSELRWFWDTAKSNSRSFSFVTAWRVMEIVLLKEMILGGITLLRLSCVA